MIDRYLEYIVVPPRLSLGEDVGCIADTGLRGMSLDIRVYRHVSEYIRVLSGGPLGNFGVLEKHVDQDHPPGHHRRC